MTGKGTQSAWTTAAAPCNRISSHMALLLTPQRQHLLQSTIYHPTGSDFQHDEDGFRKCYWPQITLFTHHAHSSRSSSHFLGKRNSEPPCYVKPCPERGDSFQPFLYLVSKTAQAFMFWIWRNQKAQQEVIILSKSMTFQSRNSSRRCCKATKISPVFCKTSRNLRVTCFSLGLSL